ncbi:amidohydrolase family protein [Devosia sp.]|uniref:amidohydrolase family protein n=1 Tax=Devosia sp. TaxID=1871048 RepID=UPI003BACEF3D
MRIVDTHLHLVYQDRLTYPWLASAPALNRQWTAESYFAEAIPLGIETALHMEVDVAEAEMEAETRFVLTLDPRIGGAIAAARPESSDFPDFLERLIAIVGVNGIRRILHTSPDELSGTPLFADNIRRIGSAGLPFDLCVLARQLKLGAALVAKCPDTQFVLDHCGVPDITGTGLDPWRADIKALAALPNVAAKISGVIAYAGPDWTVETLRPYVEHIIACFGWDRVVWGSDHPVCTLTADLTRWVNATKAIVSGASVDEQSRLFHRNAERIYRLGRVAS